MAQLPPSLAHFPIEIIIPCPCKPLAIPVFDPGHKLNESDLFAGQHLILYQPDQPRQPHFKYEGVIELVNIRLHLNYLLLEYGTKIVKMCDLAHLNCRPRLCSIRSKHVPQAQKALHLGYRLIRSQAANSLSFSLLEQKLFRLLSKSFLNGSPTSVDWTNSTKGLAKICVLLQESSFQSRKRTWDVIINAHMQIGGLNLTSEELLMDEKFIEHPDTEEAKAMLGLRRGQYEELFVYTQEG